MFCIRSITACVVAAVCFLSSSAVFADGRHGGHHGGHSGHHHGGGISFGGFYGGSGYGYGGYYGSRYGGYGYGYPYGSGLGIRIYSSPSYVYPSYSYPSYYSAPTYVTPSYTYPSTQTVIVEKGSAPPDPSYDGGPIVITSPATNEKPVEYSLNSHGFAMKPGQSQTFKHDRHWVVQFDQGGGRGLTKYTLKSGTYKFKQTENGWQLFQAAASVPEPTSASAPPPPAPIDSLEPTLVLPPK